MERSRVERRGEKRRKKEKKGVDRRLEEVRAGACRARIRRRLQGEQ